MFFLIYLAYFIDFQLSIMLAGRGWLGGGGVASMMNEAIFNQKVSMLLFIPAYTTIMGKGSIRVPI